MLLLCRKLAIKVTKHCLVPVVLLASSFGLLANEAETTITSSNPTSAIIQGVSKWQANRFEKRVVNKTLYNIRKNVYFKKWFPITEAYLDDFDSLGFSGVRLLPSIHNNVDLDLERLLHTFNDCVPVFLTHKPTNLTNLTDKLRNLINSSSETYTMDSFYYDVCFNDGQTIEYLSSIEVLQKLLKVYNGTTPNEIQIAATLAKLKREFESVSDLYTNVNGQSYFFKLDILSDSNPIQNAIASTITIQVCSDNQCNSQLILPPLITQALSSTVIADLKQKLKPLTTKIIPLNKDVIKTQIQVAESQVKFLAINRIEKEIKNIKSNINNKTTNKKIIYYLIKHYNKILQQPDLSKTTIVRQLIPLLDDLIKAFQNDSEPKKEPNKLARFAKTAIWLSEINDVAHQNGSSDTVKAEEIAGLIDNFIDDESTWRYKYKEPSIKGGKLLVTSYVGLPITASNVNPGSSETYTNKASEFRIFAPIGVEWVFHRWKSSKWKLTPKTMGFNLSPFDIGRPLAIELFDSDVAGVKTNSITSIWSPSWFFSFSGTDVSYLIGHQRDVPFISDSNKYFKDDIWFITLALDFPVKGLFSRY